MTSHINARHALPPDLDTVLDELDIEPETDPFAGRVIWYAAAMCASSRYYDWALEEHLDYLAFLLAAEARAIERGNALRAAEAGERKQRRIKRAAKEGREYQTRSYTPLKDMSPEERAAHRREQKRVSQQLRRNGPPIESHPLHGRYH
jgi:hypothetical protein